MPHDTDAEKLDAVYQILEADDAEGIFSEWEYKFITNNWNKQQEMDFVLTEKQSRSLDEIYEKAYRAALVDGNLG